MKTDGLVQYLSKTGIQQYKTDVGFRTLVESVNENMYIIPKYQRKYRWNKAQVIALVESLLRGLPIPPIYTCRNEKNQLEILDGQQRVMSLFFYYMGYFLDKRKMSAINFSDLEIENETFFDALMRQYSLEKLAINLTDSDGKRVNVDYASLPIEIKRRVDYTTITVVEIKIDQNTRREEVLRTIFSNLNRGGTLLSAQEQRNGIYNCIFYDKLQEFNKKNKRWRKLWGREDSREKDLETLLRFCALKKYVSVKGDRERNFIIDGYNSSYVRMLDRFSEEALKFDEQEWDEYRKSLTDFLELFETNTTWSSKVALLESFYVNYEKMGVRTKITENLYEKIIDSQIYKMNSRQGTVSMKKMNGRWNVVYEIWSGADQ